MSERKYLYGRVSTTDQDAGMQEKALRASYPDGIYFEEKKSGTTIEGRAELQMILKVISEGESLVVWKLDRLARNVSDLSIIVQLLKDRGAHLEILDQKIDTSSASGNAFLQMLGVFAEFETNLRRERQAEGIAKAKAEGKHLGRKALLSDDDKAVIREKHKAGTTPTELAKEYGVSRATVYNVIR